MGFRFQPGGRVHQYEIISLLGAGGMGEVYLARNTRLQQPVVLKLLLWGPNLAREQLQRFEQEARAASALSHSNVCVNYEINETEAGEHYIAMEYVEGATLREPLERAPVAVEEAIAIATQVASVLASAHKANIIHRDIKPENIMLRDDGQVKLLDFSRCALLPGERLLVPGRTIECARLIPQDSGPRSQLRPGDEQLLAGGNRFRLRG
jgi:serine/threonine protein kinase